VSDSDPKTAGDTADTDAAGLDEPTDEYGGLMFRWSDRSGRGAGLAVVFFIGVALLVHAVGFYLFQVNAPISARVEAHSAKVTMLDPNDASTAALLREVDDRLVFLRPASLGTGSRLRIEDFSVTFEPSFLKGEVEFRPPAGASEKEQLLSELLPKDGLVLPPVATIAEEETGGPDGNKEMEPDLAVLYSTDGSIRIPGIEAAQTLAEASGFFDQQSAKKLILVEIADRALSAAERDGLLEKLREYFLARGYQRVSFSRAGTGRAGEPATPTEQRP
jgi:hypothetical protein